MGVMYGSYAKTVSTNQGQLKKRDAGVRRRCAGAGEEN